MSLLIRKRQYPFLLDARSQPHSGYATNRCRCNLPLIMIGFEYWIAIEFCLAKF
jgi:hypothetical protein